MTVLTYDELVEKYQDYISFDIHSCADDLFNVPVLMSIDEELTSVTFSRHEKVQFKNQTIQGYSLSIEGTMPMDSNASTQKIHQVNVEYLTDKGNVPVMQDLEYQRDKRVYECKKGTDRVVVVPRCNVGDVLRCRDSKLQDEESTLKKKWTRTQSRINTERSYVRSAQEDLEKIQRLEKQLKLMNKEYD